MIASRTTAAAAIFSMLFTSAAHAQAAPDAGQIARETQPPALPPQPAAAPALAQSETPAPAPDAGVGVTVSAFQISGASAIPAAELQAAVAMFVGRSLSLGELNEAAQQITRLYRRQGYAVARAYLPPQEVKDGVVAITVLEGRFDQFRLQNHSGLSDARIGAYLDGVRPGEVIRSGQIDRGLLLLNDTPGVAGARATLRPGASVGAADLLVEANAGRPYQASFSADNYGNRYTGAARAGAGLALNSPLRIGDQLTADVLTSGRGLLYGRLAYQAPVGGDGLRVGAAAYGVHYRLGREFRSLNAKGTAASVSAFALYPFIRRAGANLSGAATVEQKELKDEVGATATVTRKQSRLVTLGLIGTRQDGLFGGGVSSFELSAVAGDLDIRSPGARAVDALTARSNGGYGRINLELGRFQRVTRRDILVLTASGQRASENLDSSEKFAIAGVNAVRAYPQGEGIGDEGELVSVEWRHDLSPALQAAVFYDLGRIRVSRDPFTPGDNTRTLSGAGVGLYARFSRIQVKGAAAWRVSGGRPTSVPSNSQPTLWAQVSAAF